MSSARERLDKAADLLEGAVAHLQISERYVRHVVKQHHDLHHLLVEWEQELAARRLLQQDDLYTVAVARHVRDLRQILDRGLEEGR